MSFPFSLLSCVLDDDPKTRPCCDSKLIFDIFGIIDGGTLKVVLTDFRDVIGDKQLQLSSRGTCTRKLPKTPLSVHISSIRSKKCPIDSENIEVPLEVSRTFAANKRRRQWQMTFILIDFCLYVSSIPHQLALFHSHLSDWFRVYLREFINCCPSRSVLSLFWVIEKRSHHYVSAFLKRNYNNLIKALDTMSSLVKAEAKLRGHCRSQASLMTVNAIKRFVES